jgi:hypothetical protein
LPVKLAIGRAFFLKAAEGAGYAFHTANLQARRDVFKMTQLTARVGSTRGRVVVRFYGSSRARAVSAGRARILAFYPRQFA